MKEELQSLNIGCTLVNAGIDKAIDKLLETIDDAVAKWNLSVAMEEYLYYFYKKNIYTRSLAKQNCKQIIYKIYQPLEIYNNGQCRYGKKYTYKIYELKYTRKW